MIQISHFQARSFVDGPGERAVLFMQGCPIECPGCQNRHLWNAQGGRMEKEIDVALSLANLSIEHGNITISGGEPFSQPHALLKLLMYLREFVTIRHIIVYSGYLYENLLADPHTAVPLRYVDVLVDGPFRRELDDPRIAYRGSRNQRPIDVPASLKAGQVMTLNWDDPEIIITPEGSALLPVGLVDEFSGVGEVHNTRRCGQTK